MSGIQMMVANNVQQAAATPGIVTLNLQLYLNAADPASYPGSGTTWTDLSPNAYSTTLVGAPTFNSTYFNFPNTTARYVDTNQSLAYEEFAVGAWFRTSAAGVKMVLSKETTLGWPWNYRIWLNGGTIIGDVALSGGTNQSISSPLTTYNNNSWYYVMFTRDTLAWYLYVNGNQVAVVLNSLGGSIVNAQELWIGRSAFTAGGSSPSGSYQWVGDIGQVFVYDRALAGYEVLQNYDATRSTYGL